MTNSLMNTFSSLTLCSLNNSKGFPFNSIKYFSRSLRYIENKTGTRFHPVLHLEKLLDWLLLYCTQDFISLYILYITLKKIPFISLLSSLFHKPILHTVSNALRKSTKVQSIFFPNRTDTMKLIHLKRKCYQL